MANRLYNKQVTPKGYQKGGVASEAKKKQFKANQAKQKETTKKVLKAMVGPFNPISAGQNVAKKIKERMGKKMGGSLKPVNPQTQKGLSKLPTEVRNKMGYMKDGGKVKKKKRFKSTKEIEDYGKQAVASIKGIGDSIRDRNTPMKFQRLKDTFKIKN